MGNTERISSHCAWRWASAFGGAGGFKVVICLLTVASSNRRGHRESERPPLYVPRGIAERSQQLPPGALSQRVPTGLDRQTPAAARSEIWRSPPRQIRLPPIPVTWLRQAVAE